MKNAELLRQVAADLLTIEVDAVFFGGTVVGLHLDGLPPDDEERRSTRTTQSGWRGGFLARLET